MTRCLGRPIRVLVIGRFTSIHTVRFCEELQRHGIKVAALWIGRKTKSVPKVLTYHTDKNMRLFGIPRTATFGCLLYLYRAINEFEPDIIHIQDDPQMLAWVSIVCSSRTLKAYTNWGHNPHLGDYPKFRRGMRKIDLITSDAQDVLEELVPYAPKAARTIVRFGADSDLFCSGLPDRDILARYSLDPNGIYIISPRSIRPLYNQLSLIRALPPLLDKFPKLKLILKHHHVENYGDSEDYQRQLREEAEQLNVWRHVIRLDHLPYDHLCHLYRLCRAAVSIPLEDGFPATIFEAMACGCPLVVSNDGSYEGVIVNNKNSVVIAPTDVAALSGALDRILSDEVFAGRLRCEGLKTVEEKGNFAKEISGLVLTYQKLLEIHGRVAIPG